MLSFSIVIPTLNQSHFLATALESLRCQSAPFNLALMDGGSTDDLDLAIKSYRDIISYFRSGPDRGQAFAIRDGLNAVSGDIVAWLNADDYYFPGILEKVAELFEENPDLDVIYGDAIHVNKEGLFLSYFPPVQEFDAKDLARSCFICQPACFVRRSAYERVKGINPKLQYTMDWDLWCRLSKAGSKMSYMHKVLAAVRYYHGTKTLSMNFRRYREIYRIERRYSKGFLPYLSLNMYNFDLRYLAEKTFPQRIFLYSYRKYIRPFEKVYNRICGFGEISYDGLIYGFYRWEPVVEGRGVIHVPWYFRDRWRRLRLKVEPKSTKYRITINSLKLNPYFDNEYLVVDVPNLNSPYRQITIEYPEKMQWKLLEFGCDLDKKYA